MRTKTFLNRIWVACALAAPAVGGEIGHSAPGVANVRDFIMPEPGVYATLYNYYYTTGELVDANGTTISSVTIRRPTGGPDLNLNVDVDVDVYALTPMLIWVSDAELAGAAPRPGSD